MIPISNRLPEGLAADRRFERELGVQESQFSRYLAQRVSEADALEAYRTRRLREQARQFDLTHTQDVLEHTQNLGLQRELESGRTTRHGITERGLTERHGITERGIASRFSEKLAQEDAHFQAQEQRLGNEFDIRMQQLGRKQQRILVSLV